MNELLKSVLDGINVVCGNYGWSIIVFTVLIRLVVMPFDYKSRKAMRQQQRLQPQINALQAKYAKDQEKLQKKLSELYRKEHVSPFASCLPMIFSMAILWVMFAAMRMVANEHVAVQVFDILQGKEPTLQGWLWIRNLWMPDSPFSGAWPNLATIQQIPHEIWGQVFASLGDAANSLPAELALTAESFAKDNAQATVKAIFDYMSAMPAYQAALQVLPGSTINLLITTVSVIREYNGLLILPVLAAGTQFLMSATMPQTPAPGANANNPQAQAMGSTGAMMKWFFPLFSLWLCSNSNAVFAIYWVAANVVAAAQNYVINKLLDRREQQAAELQVKEGTIK